MAKKVRQVTEAMAIAGLILNIMVMPGLGSLIAGRTYEGKWQLGLHIVGLLFDITIIGLIIGIPLGIGAWIWGLITGIELIKEAR